MVNAEDKKETPIVIWTSESPRCFSSLPVKYYHQKNAWMSGEILVSYLTAFNQKMKGQRRSVLLLLDNTGCHPPNQLQLQEKFSNVLQVASTVCVGQNQHCNFNNRGHKVHQCFNSYTMGGACMERSQVHNHTQVFQECRSP